MEETEVESMVDQQALLRFGAETSSGARWWVALGYPPFDRGPDGFPRPGQVLRHFRRATFRAETEKGNWSQKDLASVLNVTEESVRNMEIRDQGLDSYERRRFLSDLLKIPPILFGLAVPPDIQWKQLGISEQEPQQKEVTGSSLGSHAVDLKACNRQIRAWWSQNGSLTLETKLFDMAMMRSSLYEYLPFSKLEKSKVLETLCCSHLLSGRILRDLQVFSESRATLNKAVALSRHLKNVDLLADALYQRATTFADAKEYSKMQRDLQEVYSLLNAIAPHRRGKILALSHIEVRSFTDLAQQQAALQKMDQAMKLTRDFANSSKEDPAGVDMNRLFTYKGAIFVEMGWYQEAIDILGQMQRQPGSRRLTAFNDILLAQAYLGQKKYPLAIASLEEALTLVQEIHSPVHFSSIVSLLKRLKEGPYKHSPEVIRLSLQLQRSQ